VNPQNILKTKHTEFSDSDIQFEVRNNFAANDQFWAAFLHIHGKAQPFAMNTNKPQHSALSKR
jgi:hypothetical protein